MEKKIIRTLFCLRMRLRDFVENLPSNVFVDRMMVEAKVLTANDEIFKIKEDGKEILFTPPRVIAKRTIGMPYIPRQMILFVNPIVRSIPSSSSTVGKERREVKRVIEELETLVTKMEEIDPTIFQRTYIQEVNIIEVPEEYVYESAEGYVVDPKLYKLHIPVSIGTFRRLSKIVSEEVREKMGGWLVLPGRVVRPCGLYRIKTVIARELRDLEQAIDYYFKTEQQVIKAGKPEYAPDIMEYEDISRNPRVIKDKFPSFSESGLLRALKLRGSLMKKEVFVEETVEELEI